MSTLSRFSLIALGLVSTALQAEPPRFGVVGLVNIPLGDLKTYVDSKPGPGIGVLATFDFGDGHMLRPRCDYSAFPEATLSGINQTASNVSLGADYLYFIAEKPEGLYLTAGVAAIRWAFDTKVVSGNTSSNTTKAGLSAGVGYQWNATVGTEGRLVRSRVDSNFQALILQGCVTVRF